MVRVGQCSGVCSAVGSARWTEVTLLARVIVMAVALALPARASALSAALRVVPGASCVSADSLRGQIDAWLAGTKVSAEVTIEVTGSPLDPRKVGFVLREGSRVSAQREFDPGPSACAQLEATLALAIALALKASLLEQLVPVPTVRTGFGLGAAALALVGFTPRTPLGAQLTLEGSLSPRVWLQSGLTFWSTADNALAEGRFDLRALALRVDVCALPSSSLAWSLVGCAGTRIGGLWAHARGLTRNESAREPWVALSASLGVLLPVSSRWSLLVSAALLASVARARFEVRATDGPRLDAYTVPVLASELSVGPGYRF